MTCPIIRLLSISNCFGGNANAVVQLWFSGCCQMWGKLSILPQPSVHLSCFVFQLNIFLFLAFVFFLFVLSSSLCLSLSQPLRQPLLDSEAHTRHTQLSPEQTVCTTVLFCSVLHKCHTDCFITTWIHLALIPYPVCVCMYACGERVGKHELSMCARQVSAMLWYCFE